MPHEPSANISFSWPVQIYWEDTDAGGIVYYANYLRYFERARTEWLRSAGIVQSCLRQTESGMFVVSHVELQYRYPARLDDRLEITVIPSEIKGASMRMGQQAWRIHPITHQREQLLVEGVVRAAWVNCISLKPAKIPSMLRDMLSACAPLQP